MDSLKLMKILGVTVLDASQHEEIKGLPTDKLEIDELCKIAVCHRLVKVFHSAIILIVNQAKKGTNEARQLANQAKKQDECAYARMLEDFTKFCLRSGS